MKKQIVTNIFSGYAGKGVGLLLGIFIVPFLIWKLGPAAFGVTVLAESIIAVVEVASVSVRTALARHLTFALSKGDAREFDEFLATGRMILWRSAAVVFLVAVLVTALLPHAFKVPAGLGRQSQLLFLFMSLAFTATVPNIAYWAILYAKQRFDLINFSTSAGLILRAVSIWAVFSFMPARFTCLAVYGVIYLAMTWAQNYFIYFWHTRVLPGVRIRREAVNPKRIREILSFGVFMTINSLNTVVYDSSVQIIINLLMGPAANAMFAVSLKISMSLRRIFQQTTWTLTPTFTDLVARGDRGRLKRLLFGSMKLTALVSVPLCAFFIVFARETIRLWVGEPFALASVIMPVHLSALVLTLPLYANGCLFNAYAKLKVPCFVAVATTWALVSLGVVLMRFFHMGLLGMAVADGLMTVLYLVFFSSFYVRRVAGFGIKEFFLDSYLRPVAFAAAYWISAFALLRTRLLAGDWASAALIAVTAVVGYFLGAFALVLSREEKDVTSRNFSALRVRLGFCQPDPEVR